MPDHINTTVLVIALAITFLFRFIALFAFLLIMIKIQKLNFSWLPLIGSAALASVLDMIPFVGHFIAVPALLLCIWKVTGSELYPDASCTVGLSYALMRCLGWIVLAYAPAPQLASSHDNDADGTNMPPMAIVQTTNEAPVAEAPSAPPVPQDGVAADISVKGISHGINDALVTIQYGKKNYVISLGEGTTISTKEGMATVRFVKTDGNNVTLSVRGQEVKYALK
jgi:hypothetical protein